MSNSKLIKRLEYEKLHKIKGGIYYFTQIDLCYNSNHIEGSKLSKEQTREIYETHTFIAEKDENIKVDDVLEVRNHFRAFDYILDNFNSPLSANIIKQIHLILKNGTSDVDKGYKIGDWKTYANIVGDMETSSPENVNRHIEILLSSYNSKSEKTLDDILDFHVKFEQIHPFQDGNGRVGRLIMFKECLANNIVPFIIYDEIKAYYYRGLQKWPKGQQGYLRDTVLTAQDSYKERLEYFGIKTKEEQEQS